MCKNNTFNYQNAGDTSADPEPDCNASEEGYEDYIVFKTQMKRYSKTHADPGSISILPYTILKENIFYYICLK